MTKECKTLVFDMDGTIADFYGVKGWLQYLDKSDTTPYEKANPMYDMDMLESLLTILKDLFNYRVIVVTWLSKTGTKKFNNDTRVVKKDWLDKFSFPYDELHMVKYGTTKANCVRHHGKNQILFDDNASVRKGWSLGQTVDASKENIVEFLMDLIDMEIQEEM